MKGDLFHYKQYRARIRYDYDFHLFHGRVVNIGADIVNFYGESIEQLEAEFAESMKAYEESKDAIH